MNWPNQNSLIASGAIEPMCSDLFLQARMSSTGSSFGTSRMVATVLLSLALFAPTGTASVCDFARSSQRLSKVPYYEVAPVEHANSIQILDLKIREVRNALAISVSELALIMGVSRQAVYKWLSGGPMSELNRKRLDDLSAAASIVAPYSNNTAQAIGNRKSRTGQNLFDTLNEGITARDWAHDVVANLAVEQQERTMMNQIMASHPRTVVAKDDLGVPLLDEQND